MKLGHVKKFLSSYSECFFCVVHHQENFNCGKFSDFVQLFTISIPGATAKIPNSQLSLSIVFSLKTVCRCFFLPPIFSMWKLGPKKGGHKVSAAAAFTSFYTYWPRPLALPENTPLALLLSFFCFPNDLSALSFFTSLTMYLSWDFPTSLFPPFLLLLNSASSCHSVSQFWWKARGVFHWRCKFHLWENFLYIYHGISKKRHWTSSLIWMGLWN